MQQTQQKHRGAGGDTSGYLLDFKGGGRGRTRTYEGIASGFTVRPLCRSGHSPPKPWHRVDLERQSAPPRVGRELRVLWGGAFAKSMERFRLVEDNLQSRRTHGIKRRWHENPGSQTHARDANAPKDDPAYHVRDSALRAMRPMVRRYSTAGIPSKRHSKIPPGVSAACWQLKMRCAALPMTAYLSPSNRNWCDRMSSTPALALTPCIRVFSPRPTPSPRHQFQSSRPRASCWFSTR